MIENIKRDNEFDENKLIFPLIMAINQHVSDEVVKRKLIDAITMEEPVDEIYEKVMNSGVFEKGIEIGRELARKEAIERKKEEAMFDFAIKYKHEHGIDEAIRFTGFSREELENEELNRKDEN